MYYYPAKLNIVKTVSFSYDEDSLTRTLVFCLSIFSLDFYFCLGRFLLGAYSITCFCLYLPPKKGKLTMTFEIHSPTIHTVNRIISTPGITVDQLLGDIMAYNNEITHNVSILSAPGERYWHLSTQLICFWLCSYAMDIWDNSSEMSKNNKKMFKVQHSLKRKFIINSWTIQSKYSCECLFSLQLFNILCNRYEYILSLASRLKARGVLMMKTLNKCILRILI